MSEIDESEIEVVCASCSFPVIETPTEDGLLEVTLAEGAPLTEEEALEAGWFDSGLGLLCPKCNEKEQEETKKEALEGVQAGAGSLTEANRMMVEAQLVELHPTASKETVSIFTNVILGVRRSMIQMARGLTVDPPIEPPMPKDEAQALEFIEVGKSIHQFLENEE